MPLKLIVLLLVTLPCLAQQMQEVAPITSEHYLRLIKKAVSVDTPEYNTGSDSNSVHTLTNKYYFGSYNILGAVKQTGNKLELVPDKNRIFQFSGYYNASLALASANRQLHLQNQYSQGRSVNNVLQWRGAHEGEWLSFGPELKRLEFDGLPYAYDINGKLVNAGEGKGQSAISYSNIPLRNAMEWQQHLQLKAEFKEYYNQLHYLQIDLSSQNKQLIIPQNNNTGYQVNVKAGAKLSAWVNISAGLILGKHSFSNGNCNGLLNRIYQQMALTPVSFSNHQGSRIHLQQRSFSAVNDNPYFLLESPSPERQIEQQWHTQADLRWRSIQIKSLLTSAQSQLRNQENFQPGTTSFPDGVATDRRQNNQQLQWINTISGNWRGDNFNHQATGMVNLASAQTTIGYTQPDAAYKYKRQSLDASLQYRFSWDGYEGFNGGITVNNNLYLSSTVRRHYHWLPAINAYMQYNRLPGSGRVSLSFGFRRYVQEPQLLQSYAANNLLQIPVHAAGTYFPRQEIAGFSLPRATNNKQYTYGLDLYFNYRFYLSARYSFTQATDAVFPIWQQQQLVLKNLAAYNDHVLEISAGAMFYFGTNIKGSYKQDVHFYLQRNKVIALQAPAEMLPIAGFSNVYKALAVGEPIGAIAGSGWATKDGRPLIGADGFPIADTATRIIGNPLPDFVAKFNQVFSWGALSINIDVEWQNGGDVWNGTAAVLDYHGRSAASATDRQLTGHVFDGVLANGMVNTKPVDFYNSQLPVEQNRWVRYGYSGVAANYIQKASTLRLHYVGASYQLPFANRKRWLTVSFGVNNILLWTAYKGTDPAQVLFDNALASGLDFFNLPAIKRFTFGINLPF